MIRKADNGSEVVLVGLNFVGHEKLRWIETREGWEFKGVVCRLSEVFVTRSQRQSQVLRSFPGILEEITLSQKVRLVERNTEVDVRSAIGATEVVNEVRKAREPTASGKRERTPLVKRRSLARRLSQDFESCTEGVHIPNLGQCVLDQEVLGSASLRQVGGDADGGKATAAGETDIWQRTRQS